MFNGSDDFIGELVANSPFLKRLNMAQTRKNLVKKCLSKIPVQNSICELDFCCMSLQIANRLKYIQ